MIFKLFIQKKLFGEGHRPRSEGSMQYIDMYYNEFGDYKMLLNNKGGRKNRGASHTSNSNILLFCENLGFILVWFCAIFLQRLEQNIMENGENQYW